MLPPPQVSWNKTPKRLSTNCCLSLAHFHPNYTAEQHWVPLFERVQQTASQNPAAASHTGRNTQDSFQPLPATVLFCAVSPATRRWQSRGSSGLEDPVCSGQDQSRQGFAAVRRRGEYKRPDIHVSLSLIPEQGEEIKFLSNQPVTAKAWPRPLWIETRIKSLSLVSTGPECLTCSTSLPVNPGHCLRPGR